MTTSGITIRTKLDQVNTLGRATQGVRLINLKDDNKVSTISLVDKQQDEETEQTQPIINQEEPILTEANE